MNPVARIALVSDADAARLVSPGTAADLAERIMATPAHTPPALADTAAAPAPATPRPRHTRRWAAGLVAAAAVAALVLAVALPGRPGHKPRPVAVHLPRVAALAFVRHGGYLDVIVKNPHAAPKIYAAEFAAHHLHIKLQLVPVSPSLVGTVIFVGTSAGASSIGTITAQGRCWTGGGGSACPVGLRVPLNFHGRADVVFGRAARPGEKYESTGPVTGRGEAMHGLSYLGRTVPAVLAMLRARHVTVGHYRYLSGTGGSCGRVPQPIPASWRVWGADPWAPNQVMLSVGPQAGDGQCPSVGQPPLATPSPSPTGG
jgi:hypothetical protein